MGSRKGEDPRKANDYIDSWPSVLPPHAANTCHAPQGFPPTLHRSALLGHITRLGMHVALLAMPTADSSALFVCEPNGTRAAG